MFRRLALLPLLPFLFLVATPAWARSADPPAQARPALWAVKDKDTTIYLFGTVHLLGKDVSWLNGPVKKAFDSADTLVLEMLEQDPVATAQLLAQTARTKDGVALTSRLTPAAVDAYKKAMTDAGLPWQKFEEYDPWMPGMILAVSRLRQLTGGTEMGAEKVLSKAATDQGKRLVGLESAAEQLGYFAALPMDDQIVFLNETVRTLPDVDASFNRLMRYWSSGDPGALARELNSSMKASPRLEKVLLADRNARWAQWIAERLKKPGTVFMAVGAGHLAGANSVQRHLATLGLRASRVKKLS
jgi:uncharacterized protein YbaP (TraB family)